MTAPVIVTTPDEIARIVRAAVEEALAARQPANDAGGDWINAKVAAEILGVSTRQIAKLAWRAKDRPPALPSTRVGRLLRFRRVDVIALLERGR